MLLRTAVNSAWSTPSYILSLPYSNSEDHKKTQNIHSHRKKQSLPTTKLSRCPLQSQSMMNNGTVFVENYEAWILLLAAVLLSPRHCDHKMMRSHPPSYCYVSCVARKQPIRLTVIALFGHKERTLCTCMRGIPTHVTVTVHPRS